MAQKGKPAAPAAKPASDPVVEDLQRELKRQGFYAGEIDGSMGKSTKDAVAARDAKKRDDDERELKKEELRQSGKTADANAAETARKTKAREERQRQSESGLGILTQTTANAPAALTGVAAGRYLGSHINEAMDSSQKSKNAVLAGLAEDRKAGLTTREGARTAARISGAMPAENALLRVGGRMVPHAALGGFMAGKGAYMLSQEDPEGAFYPEMVNRGAGLGMVGAGTGIAERGILYGVAPGVAPDARSIGVIESNQLRRNGAATQQQPVAPRPVLPGSRADLMAQARRYGIKGRTTMDLTQLREAVGEAVKTTSAPRGGAATKMIRGLAGPAAAASLAYAMTPGRAEAADGSVPSSQGDALANAGIAGGIAYGAGRLIDRLPATVGGALSVMGPMSVATMDEPTPDKLAMARNTAARYLPEAMQFGAVNDAREMAQVPEPSPMRQAEPDFESQMAELQAMLGQIDEGGPAANAVQSQRVAQMQPSYVPSAPQNRLLAAR